MRSSNVQMQQAYTGVALIAFRGNATILPVGITGSHKMVKHGFTLRRPLIKVNIGKPFTLPLPERKLTKEQLSSTTDLIMRRVAELLPESYRGYYADRKG